jgi:Fic-DOC domain mobile mystery protein B
MDADKEVKPEYILSEKFVRELHWRMFNVVWAWAGDFRLSEKNLGIKYHLIGIALKQLNDDCLFWIKNRTYSEDEIAIRYKHRIVNIHCFANGNGRHSRLMADVIHKHIFNLDVFHWGSHANRYKNTTDESYLFFMQKFNVKNKARQLRKHIVFY